MTCRVVRSFPNDIQLKPVTCGECGSTELQLTQVGHVCPICAQSMLEHRGPERMIRSGAGSTSTHPMESIPWIRATIITIICIFGVSCSAWEVSYLNGATGQATEQDIVHTLGIPSEKGQLDTGKTLWTYQHKTSLFIYPVACRKYELTFNDQQVLQQWKYLACKVEQTLHWVQ